MAAAIGISHSGVDTSSLRAPPFPGDVHRQTIDLEASHEQVGVFYFGEREDRCAKAVREMIEDWHGEMPPAV